MIPIDDSQLIETAHEVAQTSVRHLAVGRGAPDGPSNTFLFQLLHHVLGPSDPAPAPTSSRLRDQPIGIRASSDGSYASSFEGHTNGLYH